MINKLYTNVIAYYMIIVIIVYIDKIFIAFTVKNTEV